RLVRDRRATLLQASLHNAPPSSPTPRGRIAAAWTSSATMLAGGGAGSYPLSVEQARADFKIYMSKLLEHSAVLDTFRPHTRQSDAAEAGAGAPAWGPPVGPSAGGGSVGSGRGSPPAGAASDLPEISFSPGYFREEHAWPRAGATTPPRSRPPPNFSWAAEPPTPVEVHRRGGGAEGGGNGWKAAWSKRFARGPIHSEYQDRKTTSAWGAGEARGGDGVDDGYDGASAPPARSVSPLPSRRRGGDNGGRSDGGEGRGHGARGRSEPPRDRPARGRPAGERRDERRRSSSSVEGAGEHGDEDHDGVGRTTARGGGVRRGDIQAGFSFSAARKELQSEDDDLAEAGRSTVVVASADPSDGRVSEWEAAGSDNKGGARYDERKWSGGREGDDGGGGRYRGDGVTAMSGGRTLDYSSQSILTEYMDEYAWPSRLPVPGRRGQRTGMGVDHVGRLLSGRRAEEPRRSPDPGVVSSLGAAADRALKAGTPRHLSEMCRLKPSLAPPFRWRCVSRVCLWPRATRRWRRWSDVRTHLLGNRPELQGFLSRFDKHRAGLTSASLRPFAEDPNLSPTEVRRVAACMVWVSRWLRALHDYLAVKEGKLDADTVAVFKAPPARSGGTAARRHSRSSSSHGRGQGTPLGSVRGRSTERATRGKMAGDADGGRGRVGTAPSAAAAAAAEGREGSRNDHHHTGHRRRTSRHLSETAATRGGSSAGQSTPVAARSAVDLEGAAVIRDEDDRGAVGFVGNLDDESQWTAGTVTSRGDVLQAPTEDQLDLGSSVVVAPGKDKENARIVRQKHSVSSVGGGSWASGVAASSSRGGAVPSSAAATAAGTATAALETGGTKDVRRGARRELSWDPQASHGCIYRHEQKSRTPSHIANPKARRPSRVRSDPILANTRWPPPVVVRARDRTEQRSAFSLEHSFLAYE
ncbi:unnamed protein product, partial [Scytosiphon promiscuus]